MGKIRKEAFTTKTLAIIQARMTSTRLPGKVMKKLSGKTVLEHDIARVKQCREIDEIIIATTTNSQDDVIEAEALKCGAKVFRGSEDDVLSRYYLAAKENGGGVIVRITSDCPLIDPFVSDAVIRFYKENEYDIVATAGLEISECTYPRGLDTEVFSFAKLEQAQVNADKSYQREHVTPYIYEHGSKYAYKNDADYSKYRWTLDTEEDFELITKIYEHLYNGKHDFYLKDIVAVMERYPELYNINSHIEQKKV